MTETSHAVGVALKCLHARLRGRVPNLDLRDKGGDTLIVLSSLQDIRKRELYIRRSLTQSLWASILPLYRKRLDHIYPVNSRSSIRKSFRPCNRHITCFRM